MDNVRKHNICINVPSSQTFRSNLFTVNLSKLSAPRKDHTVPNNTTVNNEIERTWKETVVANLRYRPYRARGESEWTSQVCLAITLYTCIRKGQRSKGQVTPVLKYVIKLHAMTTDGGVDV
jgi:hypothetical protein